MGYLTLADFTEEISMNLGGKTPGPTRLVRWFNFAYTNLGTYVQFDELEATSAFVTVQGTTDYAKPSSFLGMIQIQLWDATTTPETRYVTLQKMKREFHEMTDQAQPTHYKLRGSNIVLWPEPDQVYTGFYSYLFTPALLSADTDTTVLNAAWDPALVMLGTHHALLSLGRQEEADRWLGRFLGYVSSRLKEIDISADMPSGGLNVAWERTDISDLPDDLEE